jgi:hypothetical protein
MNKVFYITCDCGDGSMRVEWYKDCSLEGLRSFIYEFAGELGIHEVDITTVEFPCDLDLIKGIDFNTIQERYKEITEVLE